ncbi:MAG: hypothetical protein AAGJ35_02540, partial [Myxococcota bacterium]
MHSEIESSMSFPLPVVFDMETHDPDDFLTLLWLLGHPRIDLKGVTITPGSTAQVGLVREALRWFSCEHIPVGAFQIDHLKSCVSSWHYSAYGAIPPSTDAVFGPELLFSLCDEHTTLIIGASPRNLGRALQMPGFRLGRWVAQGGFAGVGVVPEEKQLPQFRGLRTCPTFNLNGAPRAVLAALKHPGIGRKRFVSKNVCHRVIYDLAMHDWLGNCKEHNLALQKIWQGMDVYLQKKNRKDNRLGYRCNEQIVSDPVRLIDLQGQNLGFVALA